MQIRRSSKLAFIVVLAATSLGASTALAAGHAHHRHHHGRGLGHMCPMARSHHRGHGCGCPTGPIPASPRGRHCPRTVSVAGAVLTPATLTGAQLAAMPQTTFTVGLRHGRSVSATGVALETVVQNAQPTVAPSIKNGLLRVTIAVAGHRGRATFGEGELDPSFGNHPAYLALTEPRLVVDGDVKGGRYVSGLVDLVVGRGTPPRAGAGLPGRRHR